MGSSAQSTVIVSSSDQGKEVSVVKIVSEVKVGTGIIWWEVERVLPTLVTPIFRNWLITTSCCIERLSSIISHISHL